jgi:hypothetical protein
MAGLVSVENYRAVGREFDKNPMKGFLVAQPQASAQKRRGQEPEDNLSGPAMSSHS